MAFSIPELIREILKKDCTVEMEPLDANFADKLITHLYAPDKDLDIDFHSIEGERVKIEVWGMSNEDPPAYPYPVKDVIFDMNSPNFVKSLTEFLLEHLHGSLVKIRFQRRKNVNNSKDKTEESPQ